MDEIRNLFGALVNAENALNEAEAVEKDRAAKARAEIIKLDVALTDARLALTSFMRENGVLEDTVESGCINYKLSFSKPRPSVKADANAAPDEFVEIIRKPKLKEIGEHILNNPVNWASFEYGESKLQWKPVKKG